MSGSASTPPKPRKPRKPRLAAPTPSPGPSKPSLKEKLKRFYSLRALAAYPWFAGLVTRGLHYIGVGDRIAERIDAWYSVASDLGGTRAMLAEFITSGYFDAATAGIGLGYLLFFGEAKNSIKTRWAPIISLIFFGLIVLAVATIGAIGAVDLEIKKEAASLALQEASEMTGSSQANDNVAPLQIMPRSLSAKQEITLINALSNDKSFIPRIIVAIPPVPGEAIVYQQQFFDVFQRVGIPFFGGSLQPADPTQVGLMIAVPDPNNISEDAKKFIEDLEISNLPVKIVKFNPHLVNMQEVSGTPSFIFFIGPAPL